MNNVRPLVTITVLGAVAWFLYVKINQGALRPGPAPQEAAQAVTPAGVPPLSNQVAAADKSAASSAGSLAPQWPSAAGANAPGEPNPKSSQPNVPSIPELPALPAAPELPATPGTSPPVIGSTMPAIPPVANAPTAPPAFPGTVGTTSPLTSASEQDSAAENAMKAMGLTPQATTGSTPPSAGPRYGGSTDGTTNSGLESTAAPTARYGGSFATSWPRIQEALDRGELARAHLMLSPFLRDPTLTPADAERVEALLGQLAGTVIYSTEHRLEPPYTVKTGESLETIARQLDVPWQLLAKINGMSSPDQVRPGQQLKVIRGPFVAMVDLRRNEMRLALDGRYAGKFAISAPAGANIPNGEWVVTDKPVAPASTSVYASPGSLTAPSPPPARSILLRGAAGDVAKQGMIVRIAADATDPATLGSSARPDSAPKQPTLVKVSSRDVEELSDILSIGSLVQIVR